MTDKIQKIRKEVERLQNELIQEKEKGFGSDSDDAFILELQNVLTYIDSLQEEPVSEDLLKELKGIVNIRECVAQGVPVIKIARHFANWQKKQMMAKAVDGDVTFDYYGDADKTYGCIAHDSFCLEDFGLKDRDKVRMILIKESKI